MRKAAAVGVIVVAIAGCGDTEEAAKKPPAPVRLTVDAPGTAKGKVATVTGTVRPATAKVVLDGDTALEVGAGGSWSAEVKLANVGVNSFEVVARAPKRRSDSEPFSVNRALTKREIAAKRAAERRRRVLAAQKAERERVAREQAAIRKAEAFKASAETIPYNQLEKNPDRLSGRKVKYQGQIFQIQEDGGQTIVLLAVTNEGYDIWDDNVWVDIDHPIKSAEDDIITVYGVVEGQKSYETQIGGETYVPQITAKYVEE